MVLWVLDGNDRARRFYARQGFSPDGLSKHDERLDSTEIRLHADVPGHEPHVRPERAEN